MAIDARLLGPLEVDVAAHPIRLGGRQQRALLARLLLDLNRTVAVDRLVDDLWGENVPETAVKMIHVHVSRLRRALPPSVLVTRSPGYALELQPDSLDLIRFDGLRERGRAALAAGAWGEAAEHLRDADALWRGPPLAEFDQPFAVTERARLEELRLSCLEDRIDADLALGRHAELVGEIESLIARQPLRERLRRQLMLALYRSARQAEALAVYRDFRRLLSEELAIEPSSALRELEQRMLRQDAALLPDPHPPRRPAPRQRAARGGLVGRARELDLLRESLDEALAGTRRLVFVSGDPGVGKTALAERFLEEAEAVTELRVGIGQCVEHSGAGEPYLPLLDALAHLCRAPYGELVVELLRRQAPSWLVQMPWLRTEEEANALAARGELTRERMLREFMELLDSLAADRPVVLVLEDLHWSDHSSVDLLGAFGRRSGGARVLVLGTYRQGELRAAGHALHRIAHELRVRGLCEEIALETLGEEALGDYIADRFPERGFPAGFARVLKERTSGNPLFVDNVLRAWIREGALAEADGTWTLRSSLAELERSVPASLRTLIDHQLERLGTDEQELLAAASVAGSRFSAALLAVDGLGVDEAERRCHALARQQQFIAAGELSRWPDGTVATVYAFKHELYRAVLYDRLPAGRRAKLHRLIGARLEAAYGGRAREMAAELAGHFVRGQQPGRAIEYLQVAAERALAKGADQEAIQHLEQALTVLPDLDDESERGQRELPLRVLLGNALMAARGYAAPAVGENFVRARELCERVGDRDYLLPVLTGLSTHAFDRGDHAQALAVSEELLRLSHKYDDRAVRSARAQIGWPLLGLGRFSEAREQLRPALGAYHPDDPLGPLYELELGIAEYATYAWALWFLGLPDQAFAVADEATARAEAAARPLTRAYTLGCDAMLHQFAHDRVRTHEQAEAALAAATEHDMPLWRAWASVPLGWALSAAGEIEEGIATISWGIDAAEETGAAFLLTYFMALLADAQGEAARPGEGLETLGAALEIAERNDERFFEAEIHRLRGRLLHQSGAPAEAAETAFQRALAVARRQQSPTLELRTAVELGRLWAGIGRDEDAARLVSGAFRSFTEGFDTPDLIRARRLLEELGVAGDHPVRSRSRP